MAINNYNQALYSLNEIFCQVPSDFNIHVQHKVSDKGIYNYSFNRDSIPELCDLIMTPQVYEVGDVYVGINPRVTKTNHLSPNMQEPAGIAVLCAEIHVIQPQLLPLDYTRLCKMACMQLFPPSFLINTSPNQLFSVWCLDEFWERTPENISLMDNFLDAFQCDFQEIFYGYRVEPVRDLMKTINIPGTMNRQNPENHFLVHLCALDGSQIVPSTLDSIYQPVRRYSLEEFLDTMTSMVQADIDEEMREFTVLQKECIQIDCPS